jgi:hypothetical protein
MTITAMTTIHSVFIEELLSRGARKLQWASAGKDTTGPPGARDADASSRLRARRGASLRRLRPYN